LIVGLEAFGLVKVNVIPPAFVEPVTNARFDGSTVPVVDVAPVTVYVPLNARVPRGSAVPGRGTFVMVVVSVKLMTKLSPAPVPAETAVTSPRLRLFVLGTALPPACGENVTTVVPRVAVPSALLITTPGVGLERVKAVV
jgi:hypothetical protein